MSLQTSTRPSPLLDWEMAHGTPNPTNERQGHDLGWRGRFKSDYGPQN